MTYDLPLWHFFSNEEKIAVVVPVTNVEVTGSETMLAVSFSTLLLMFLGWRPFESASNIWCGYLLDDVRVLPSM